ncbi:hypothetical protein [Streptomyces flaveolus]
MGNPAGRNVVPLARTATAALTPAQVSATPEGDQKLGKSRRALFRRRI